MTTTIDSQATLNTAPLTSRVNRRAVRAFYRAFTRDFPMVRNPITAFRRFMLGVGAVVMPIGILALGFGLIAEATGDEPDKVSEIIAMSGIGLLMFVSWLVILWAFVRVRARRNIPKRHYRLAWFAYLNGMSYVPGTFATTHVTPWRDRGIMRVNGMIRTATARPVEVADYEIMSGPHGNRSTQFGGYAALRLITSLPHIVLQAKGPGSSALPPSTAPVGAQRLSLEGDFDDYFTLYCPKGYERDALYLFTPDVMARLIDGVRGFDVEIMDDWLFLVTPKDVITLDPARWNAVANAINAVAAKVTRWERWRDERLLASERDASDAAPVDGLAFAMPGLGAGAEFGPGFAGSPGAIPGTGAAGGAHAAPGTGAAPGKVAASGRRLRMGLGLGSLIWIIPAVLIMGAFIVANLLP